MGLPTSGVATTVNGSVRSPPVNGRPRGEASTVALALPSGAATTVGGSMRTSRPSAEPEVAVNAIVTGAFPRLPTLTRWVEGPRLVASGGSSVADSALNGATSSTPSVVVVGPAPALTLTWKGIGPAGGTDVRGTRNPTLTVASPPASIDNASGMQNEYGRPAPLTSIRIASGEVPLLRTRSSNVVCPPGSTGSFPAPSDAVTAIGRVR
jgi:hypothetical protein